MLITAKKTNFLFLMSFLLLWPLNNYFESYLVFSTEFYKYGALISLFFHFMLSLLIVLNKDFSTEDVPPRRNLDYTHSKSFFSALKQSNKENKGNGFMAGINLLIRRGLNYIFHLLARIMPFNGPRVFFHRLRGVNIGKNVQINLFCLIDEAFPSYVFLDDNVAVADGVYMIAHSKPPISQKENLEAYVDPIIIQKGTWIGVNSTILPGVTIGEGCVVAAGSVVHNDVPDFTMVAGSPARVIKKLK